MSSIEKFTDNGPSSIYVSPSGYIVNANSETTTSYFPDGTTSTTKTAPQMEWPMEGSTI